MVGSIAIITKKILDEISKSSIEHNKHQTFY